MRRRAADAERFPFRSQEEDNMAFLPSRAGLRYNEGTIAPARRPGAGMVPGRGEACLPAEPPRPTDFPARGKGRYHIICLSETCGGPGQGLANTPSPGVAALKSISSIEYASFPSRRDVTLRAMRKPSRVW